MTFAELCERKGYGNGSRLAAHAGIQQTTVSQLRLGKIPDPRYSTLEAIADTLGVPVQVVIKAVRVTLRRTSRVAA